eukprot:CAMPEP_0198438436 /NCGR_PEP_ID=MMETSP1452-20131203/50943_1 /TAXON_ID=1181717 /ORGANISM="Synchroma pusillum, Strain CCMP3072" /LENGTH=617 /DNA_ID=CAMNT_0044159019 /DNA_START=66 /DNA_END=1919 /DNA_ORIENTATION=+
MTTPLADDGEAKEGIDVSLLQPKAEGPSKLTTVAPYILVTETCERLAYYGFAGSLVLLFQSRLGFNNSDAVVQYNVWSGACYVTPLLGGYLADTYLGRYRTIILFCLVYLGGLIMVVLGVIPGATAVPLVFAAMYTVALGTGGIKANVSTMGADQFDPSSERDLRDRDSFFSWFYGSVNVGALLAYLGVAYIAQYGIPALGGLSWSFFVAYTIPAVAMGLALLTFIIGTPRYRIIPAQGSVLATTLKVAWEAGITNRKAPHEVEHWLDRAKLENGGSFEPHDVDPVKYITRLMVFMLPFVGFWASYSSMSTTFQLQACQMNLDAGGFDVPVAALNVADTIAILIFIPIFETYLFPYLERKGYPLSTLQKVGLGLIVSAMAVTVAGLLEIYRRDHAPDAKNYLDGGDKDITPCRDSYDYNPFKFQKYEAGDEDVEPAYCHKKSGCDDRYGPDQYLNLTCIHCDDIPQIADISVFWQIPQFTLIGISEILGAVGGLEFFYSQAPNAMRSVAAALNLLTTAFGSWIIIPLVYIVNANPNDPWVGNDANSSHLDYYFFLLAGIVVLCWLLLCWLARDFVYKTPQDEEEIEPERLSSAWEAIPATSVDNKPPPKNLSDSLSP